jgi:lipoprotein-anchoring transpeptidase ErfK/SrfK
VFLPLFAAKRGTGCIGAFLQVGPSAWVCDQAVEIGLRAPIDPRQHTFPATSDGLPFRYFFVGSGGSLAYKRAEAVDISEPDMELEPGFAVAIVAERVFDGARYGRTGHELWVPMRDLGPVRSFAFQGESIPRQSDGGALPVAPEMTSIPFAWVVSDRAKISSRPTAGALTSASRGRFEVVAVLEEVQTFAGKFTRIGDDAWIASKDLRHPVLAEPPREVDVAAGERWIDVELATQTLVAYEGKRPVFATLVSTGKGRQGTALATPTGTHRIWIKLLVADMDNLEDENAARYYRMEDVPYVQYFSKGVGLHGAFWHRSFGQVRSHGCVNLAPLDAQRLFWWTGPHLPAGWTAVFPTKSELGTIVRVR